MKPPRRPRGAAAVAASALLLSLAFCPFSALPGPLEALLPVLFGLLGPVPFLLALARGGGGWHGFWLGVLWSLGASAWLIDCYPGLGWIALAMMLVVAGTLTAPLGWALGRLRERHGPAVMLAWAPAVWCAWELFRAIPPLGSPWCSLGHTLWRVTPLIQVCDLAGFGLLSFMLLTVSAGLARYQRRDPAAWRPLAAGVAMLSGSLLYGAWSMATYQPELGRPVSVAMVQAFTPKELKRPGFARELFWTHYDASRLAPPGTELLLWPETAVPARLMEEPWSRSALTRLADDLDTTLIAGGLGTPPAGWPEMTSCAFVIGPDGTWHDTGEKVHLVIFAEYTPGRRWLPPVVTRLTEQFTPGERFRAVTSPLGRLALPICYESVFPGDVRRMVRAGAELLCVLTNDDQLSQWGARQHYQQAVFRCVEQRRWMARCANSGISAVIDPLGRPVSTSDWAEKTVFSGRVHLRDDRTVYQVTGESSRILLGLLVVGLLFAPRKRPVAA